METNVQLFLCPVCGSELKKETRKQTATYKNRKYSYKQTGDWCDECGNAFFNPEELNKSRKERTDKKRKIGKMLTSRQIRKFRKEFELTQSEASLIFGGGPMVFTKYERGEISQTKSTDMLMKLLINGVVTLEDVRSVDPDSE